MSTATDLAWKLIDECPWVLKTPEQFILLRLARLHDKGRQWVSIGELQHQHSGGSAANVKQLLEAPRLRFDDYNCIVTTEGQSSDGKTRTFYKLKGWWG